MAIVEFALITAFCLAPLSPLRRGAAYPLVAAAMSLLVAVVWIGSDGAARLALTARTAALPRSDSPEYQPAGYPHPYRRAGYADPGLDLLAKVPPIACMPAARVCSAEEGRVGAMKLEIDSDQPTTVVLRRFFFPSWRLDPSQPLVPSDPLRLVSFRAPAGRNTFQLLHEALPAERWGALVSLLSIALLLAWLGLSAFNVRRSP
jgi:hypothetical protein